MRSSPPLLWHLKVSHYNEKARWALDYKGIPHLRKALEPGRHAKVARRLSGGDTTPVLELDGEAIGDSTAIIAALEEHQPDPPLYPEDDADRERALALEDHFDEQLGPRTRLLAIHHTSTDGDLFLGTFLPDAHGARRRVAVALFPVLRRRINAEFGITEESVEAASESLHDAGDRLRQEAGETGYLIADRFTVADLTLASLLAPLVAPIQFPYPQPQRDHPAMAPVRKALDEAGLREWCREMYARHRGTTAEVAG